MKHPRRPLALLCLVFFCCLLPPFLSAETQTAAVTIHIDGMMKSASGAT